MFKAAHDIASFLPLREKIKGCMGHLSIINKKYLIIEIHVPHRLRISNCTKFDPKKCLKNFGKVKVMKAPEGFELLTYKSKDNAAPASEASSKNKCAREKERA